MELPSKNVSIPIQVGMILLLLGLGVIFVVVQAYRSSGETLTPDVSTEQNKLTAEIARLSEVTHKQPDNLEGYIELSQLYLQKVRDTADGSYYQKIADLMNQAETIEPMNSKVWALRASVALGRHQFIDAKKYAERAIKLDPNDHLNFGLRGDAAIELGEYESAARAFQSMVDLRPDYSAYIRIAYLRELYGDIEGAKQFLRLAISTGSNFTENSAFAYVELGKLESRDDPEQASKEFGRALVLVPEYPSALEGLGKIAFFEKDFALSEAYFLRAYNKLPLVQFAIDLGDLSLHAGKTEQAARYFTLTDVAFAQAEKSGIDTDLEQSLFLNDHDRDLPVALAQAERAYLIRPSVYAADNLAWALYKNKQFSKAATYEKDALRLGQTDPLILFHQGMIAASTGEKEKAIHYLSTSLRLHPRFSILQVENARAALNNLSL